jgi:hypothetical protein
MVGTGKKGEIFMWKRITEVTLLLCVTLLLTSCSGYIRVDITPALSGSVAIGPIGQNRYLPIQYANVYTSDAYRRYDAYYAYSTSEYRFPSLTPGYYDIQIETLFENDSIPRHYPTDYYFRWDWLPYNYDNHVFAELCGMYYLQEDGTVERPLTRWKYGTVTVYIDPLLNDYTIRGILRTWEQDILSSSRLEPCVRFQITNSLSADLRFFYLSGLGPDVEGRATYNNGYLGTVDVGLRNDAKLICNYAIAQAMGMGTSSEYNSVLHWSPERRQRDYLTDEEKDYAKMMYSIEPGLVMNYAPRALSFLEMDDPSSIDFEMAQGLESGSFKF